MGGRKGRDNVDWMIEVGGGVTDSKGNIGEWVETMWVAKVWRSIGWGTLS